MTDTGHGEIREIGEVAALNIVQVLDLPKDSVKKVQRAIADEIQLMSSHFTMAVAEAQTHYEADVLKIKATWSFVEQNKAKVFIAAVGLFSIGALVGAVVSHFA